MTKKLYKVGHILNPLYEKIDKIRIKGRTCKIVVPARVNTFLCHHNLFVKPPEQSIYPVNSINFAVAKFTEAIVTIRDDNEITIDAPDKHKAIVEHVVRIIQKTLKIRIGFDVIAKNLHEISHGGLGSSSAIMSAVAGAINILMSRPLSVEQITKLISQNYGEESVKKGYIIAGASIGGSTATGLSGKPLVIMGGESEIWYSGNLPKEYYAVLIYPRKLKTISKNEDNKLNKGEVSLLETVDDGWGNIKEDILKGRIIPKANKEDYSPLFRAVNMYTIGAYGDIPNYFNSRWTSYGLNFNWLIRTIFLKLFALLEIDKNCFFVSSNGPLITVITKSPNKVQQLLKDLNKNFILERVSLSRGVKITVYK